VTTTHLLWSCIVRSRCPCCAQGPIFEGWLRIRRGCPRCGLLFDQWVGEWITPTYLASTLGMLFAFALLAAMFATGHGLDGPVRPEISVGALSSAVALAALRPSKAFWLAFLYLIGGVEVSAETRAQLRWWATEYGDEASGLAAQAERRARTVHAPEDPEPAPIVRRFVSWRGLFFPARATAGPPRGARSGEARDEEIRR
jgi:uncharacterized protein (DUF983 family)